MPRLLRPRFEPAQLRVRVLWGLTAACATVASCEPTTAPGGFLRPALARIGPDLFAPSLGGGGYIVIGAQPADTSFRLPVDRRVPIELFATSGDREIPALYRETCPARDRGPKYTCFEFLVYMKNGVSVRTLSEHVHRMGGRFATISSLETWAAVIVFDPNEMIERTRSLLERPGVNYVATEVAFCIGAPEECSLANLAIAVPVDTGAVRPLDGTLQLRSRDTVTIRYFQPDGSVLESRLVAP